MKQLKLAPLALCLLLIGCNEEQVKKTQPALYVSSFTVAEPQKNIDLVFKGKVVAAEETPIAFRRAGEVTRVLVKEGQQIKKGQLIATLDESKTKQDLADAKARYDLVKKQLARGKELKARSMVSAAELDELVANEKLLKAQYALAKNQQAYTQLVAPFSGTVGSLDKERFERVEIGEPVISLYQDDKVYVEVDLSDDAIFMAESVETALQYEPNVSFSGVSGEYPMFRLEHRIEPNEDKGSYQIWFAMDQIKPTILPGTTATLRIDANAAGLHTTNGFLLPLTTLESGKEQGEFFVWKVVNGTVERTAVVISQIQGQGALVISGVQEGDQLVNSNLRQMRNKKQVIIMGNKN